MDSYPGILDQDSINSKAKYDYTKDPETWPFPESYKDIWYMNCAILRRKLMLYKNYEFDLKGDLVDNTKTSILCNRRYSI